jgi:hypothetical protein
MKKILITTLALTMISALSYADNSFGTSLKNAVKQDISATKSSVKSTVTDIKTAAKQDVENAKQEQATTAAAKKAEKLKQIDAKLDSLNEELTVVKNDKGITETERTLKSRTLQRQIDFYNNQKKALK